MEDQHLSVLGQQRAEDAALCDCLRHFDRAMLGKPLHSAFNEAHRMHCEAADRIEALSAELAEACRERDVALTRLEEARAAKPTVPETAIEQIDRHASNYQDALAAASTADLIDQMTNFHRHAFGKRVPDACGFAYALLREAARRLER